MPKNHFYNKLWMRYCYSVQSMFRPTIKYWSWPATSWEMLCARQGISAVVGCQSVKVMEGWGRARKYNKGRKLIILPFDGFLYLAVLSSLTSASWVHIATTVVLPLGNKARLSCCSFWCLHLSAHLERQKKEVWIQAGAGELHWKEPSSTWNRARWGDM